MVTSVHSLRGTNQGKRLKELKMSNKMKFKKNGLRRTLSEFLHIISPRQDDLRLSGLSSGEGVNGRARARDRRVPADLRADSLATVPPTPNKDMSKAI
ncbi:hypothetical protein PoB_004230600 [Plakobranchus ocellatus]|uniref:Uncharacterized protein n=1 Tax=Plakobranchus ocellatus TaxID=259542 RepID=A0AAV4B5T2_9GAST|nr:hypothetical protein PoB_004230600 [Plakobranchus ocellatus]